MAKLNNEGVIKAFFNGEQAESHTGNLWVSADRKRLMNYATCLVERNAELNMLIINRSSYSVTTSKIQGMIGSHIWRNFSANYREEFTIEVDNVYEGTAYLYDAAKKKIEWAKGLHDVKIINYFDVWGNKKDGWEINNLCEEEETFELHENDSYNHEKITKKLKEVGFLNTRTRINQLAFEDLPEFGVEVYQRKDMKPICRIEFVK